MNKVPDPHQHACVCLHAFAACMQLNAFACMHVVSCIFMHACGCMQIHACVRTVILYDFESITMFTLVARAHSVATGAPRYRFHRLDPGRLSGKFGSEIVPLQRSPQPGGVPGSYMHAW